MCKGYELCFCGLFQWWINVVNIRVMRSCDQSNKSTGSAVNVLDYEEGYCPVELGTLLLINETVTTTTTATAAATTTMTTTVTMTMTTTTTTSSSSSSCQNISNSDDDDGNTDGNMQ